MFTSFKIILILSVLVFYSCDRITDSNIIYDDLPPAIPSGLKVYSAFDAKIIIEWILNNESDVVGYNIYRSINDTLSFRKIYFTTEDYFVDDSLSYDETYYYSISALDSKNNESQRSYIISAKPVNIYPPLKPRFFEINARNWIDSLSVFIIWESSLESDIAGYKVYRSEQEDFLPDSTNYLDFTTTANYLDKKNLELFTQYFYRVKVVDWAGLESEPGNEITDIIYGIPEIVFPEDNSITDYFSAFKIKSISFPAAYKIIVQSNQYFNEIWNKEFSSSGTEDTLNISFDFYYLERNKTYYWRVITYSEYSSDPNSISELYKFTIKP